jgi:hypothetical protein
MIDQFPVAVVVVNAPIIGALTTCHPHRCYSPFPKRGCTSCSGTNCPPLRFPNQDLATKEHETDQPRLDGRFHGFRLGGGSNWPGVQSSPTAVSASRETADNT